MSVESRRADIVPIAMDQDESPRPDPWQAFGYLTAGVLFYGGLGFVLDRWLETQFLVVVGIFVGAGLGIYMTFQKFGGTKQDNVTELRQERQ